MVHEESDALIPEWISTSTMLSQNEVHPDTESHETSEDTLTQYLKTKKETRLKKHQDFQI